MFLYTICLLALTSFAPVSANSDYNVLDHFLVTERSNFGCDACQLFIKLVQNELRSVDSDTFMDVVQDGFDAYHRELYAEFGLEVNPQDEVRFLMDAPKIYDEVTINHTFNVCVWFNLCNWNDEVVVNDNYDPLGTCPIVEHQRSQTVETKLRKMVDHVLNYARVMRNYEMVMQEMTELFKEKGDYPNSVLRELRNRREVEDDDWDI